MTHPLDTLKKMAVEDVDRDAITLEEFYAIMKGLLIAMKQTRLSYDLGLEAGNATLDAIITGLEPLLEDLRMALAGESEDAKLSTKAAAA